jgi:hypothetical protein
MEVSSVVPACGGQHCAKQDGGCISEILKCMDCVGSVLFRVPRHTYVLSPARPLGN